MNLTVHIPKTTTTSFNSDTITSTTDLLTSDKISTESSSQYETTIELTTIPSYYIQGVGKFNFKLN